MSRYPFATLVALLFFVLTIPTHAQSSARDAWDMARERLLQQGYAADDLSDVVVKDDYTDQRTGMRHTYLRQRVGGVEVFNGDIALHVLPNGTLFKMSSGAVRNAARSIVQGGDPMDPENALRMVLAREGLSQEATLVKADPQSGVRTYHVDGVTGADPFVQLHYLPTEQGLRAVWNVNVELPDASHWWNVLVDAASGEELHRIDWVAQCAFDAFGDGTMHDHAHAAPAPPAPAAPNDYNVYALPLEAPSFGPRSLQNAPWNAALNASPYGWHDTNGASGAEFTITRGNNVWAQEDADGNNGTGYSPDGGATLDFDFPINLSNAPSTYQDAAITNLFYWNNVIHDVLYQYGFDEPSGNFQATNYSATGLGNDFVYADAQDGSGLNNANFGTPPDGSNPRMQMFLWSGTPQIDGDLDNGIIAHEYGHGVSNRLVGGPGNTSCLGNAEQMGEGWSDFLSLIFTMQPGDQASDARGIGTYALNQAPSGAGIRPAPYSTSFGVNPYTYANTNSGLSQPHGIGFVWCTMLWEMTWELIGAHGFDPDIYNGTGGNNLALQLVLDGLKLTPCNPGFVDGRDAILQADQINNGGANQNLIWAAFARRGLGASADQGSSSSRSDQAEAFDLPVDDNVGISSSLHPKAGPVFNCSTGSTVKLNVRNSGLMDQANFAVSYRLDNDPVVTQNYPGILPAGSTGLMDFGINLNISGIGPHTFKAWTALPGDLYLPDDTLTLIIDLLDKEPIPYTEDLEGGNLLPLGWALDNPDNGITWNLASITNGPDCTPTSAWRMDHYTYGSIGQEDALIGPVIDLGTSQGTRLHFDHAYVEYSASYTDGFRIEVSSDCGATWNVVFQQSGPALATAPAVTSNWTPTNCSQWRSNTVDLSAYDGMEVRVKFVSENGYGNNFFMDNIVVELSPDNDIAIDQVLSPLAGTYSACNDPVFTVTMEVSNQGVLDQTAVPVAYRLNNDPVVNGTVPGTLSAGSSTTYSFPTPLLLPGAGPHVLKVWSALPGDAVPTNDTLVVDLILQPAAILPLMNDFEADGACAVTSNCGTTICPLTGGWTNATNGVEDDIDWRVDAGGTPSSGTGPSQDLVPGTANGKYIYLEASNGCTNREAWLLSPCLPLASTVQPTLRLGYHMYGSSIGELHVDLYDGTTWTTDITPAVVGDQGNQWDTLTVDLSPWLGDDVVLRFRGITGGGFASDMALDAIEVFDAAPPIQLSARMFLDGPFDPQTGLMRDDLRVAGSIPATEPYTSMGFDRAGAGGEAIDDPAVLQLTGNDAVVDWVLVELRDQVDPSVIVATAAGLLQRDGDIVGVDGQSPLFFTQVPGDYHVAVRHRNHLGCMTLGTVAVGLTSTTVDLSLPSTAMYGTNARKAVNSVRVLWSGNVRLDDVLRYTGQDNDRDPILSAIGGSVPTSTVSGYLSADTNMDGYVRYTGSGNDRDPMLGNIGGIVPTAVRSEQLP